MRKLQITLLNKSIQYMYNITVSIYIYIYAEKIIMFGKQIRKNNLK